MRNFSLAITTDSRVIWGFQTALVQHSASQPGLMEFPHFKLRIWNNLIPNGATNENSWNFHFFGRETQPEKNMSNQSRINTSQSRVSQKPGTYRLLGKVIDTYIPYKDYTYVFIYLAT